MWVTKRIVIGAATVVVPARQVLPADALARRLLRDAGHLARSLVAVALLASLLVGALACASSGSRFKNEEDLLTHLRASGVSQVVVPFALDLEMVSWLHQEVPSGGSDAARLGMLADRLLAASGLGVTYTRDDTGTAREVFDSKEANCLAFTNLFVGMARSLEIEVEFLEVRDLDNYRREGDLIVHSDHVAVGFGPRHQRTIIDFASEPGPKYRRIRTLTDSEATGLYYSNRGTELLRDDDLEGAYRWLSDSVKIAPSLAIAWVNLGVVLRRLGNLEASEKSYRQALEVDPDEYSAYQNLSTLLNLLGREEEAADLLAVTDTKKNRDPFSFLALGDLSLKNARWDEANRFYRRALRVRKEDAVLLAGLGMVALKQDDPKAAGRWLRKARKIDHQEPRVLRLAAEIARQKGSSEKSVLGNTSGNGSGI